MSFMKAEVTDAFAARAAGGVAACQGIKRWHQQEFHAPCKKSISQYAVTTMLNGTQPDIIAINARKRCREDGRHRKRIEITGRTLTRLVAAGHVPATRLPACWPCA